MRILMVHPGPDYSVADVFRGWEKAFRAQGHVVKVYNTNDRMAFYGRARVVDGTKKPCDVCEMPAVGEAIDPGMVAHLSLRGLMEDCYTFWPDMVFFVSAFFTPDSMFEIIRARGHKIVILHTESPYQDDEQMKRGKWAHLNLLNDPCNIDAWQDMGIPTEYMPHAYDPDLHHPRRGRLNEALASDFCFIGSAFTSRQKFFHEFFQHIDPDYESLKIALGGSIWDHTKPEYRDVLDYLGHDPSHCMENEEAVKVYQNGKVGINFYRREGEESHLGEGWAMGPREIEMAACGLFFLRDPRGESDEVFGDILPAFHSPEEAADLLRYWAKNDIERRKRAKKARARIADRTFGNNAADLMLRLEELGLKRPDAA